MASLATDDLGSLTSNQLAAFTTTQLEALTTAQIASLDSTDIGAFTTAQLRSLSTRDIVALDSSDFAGLSTAQVASLGTDQLRAMETQDVAALTTDGLVAISTANIDAWTSEIERSGLDAVIINASGCGTTVKDYGFMLRDDPAYAERAARIAGGRSRLCRQVPAGVDWARRRRRAGRPGVQSGDSGARGSRVRSLTMDATSAPALPRPAKLLRGVSPPSRAPGAPL